MNFFDLHADTPLCWAERPFDKTAVNLRSHPFAAYTQTLAIFLREGDHNPFATYCARVTLIRNRLQEMGITRYSNRQIPKSGVILSVENAGFLADDPSFLERMHADGICMVGLTWNGDNRLAGGCLGNQGLTDRGREVIDRMNHLGMTLDVSHLSEAATLEAITLADRVVASHSCAAAVFPHQRNVSLAVLQGLHAKNGLVGLCFYPAFLGSRKVVSALCRQIDYLCSLGMERQIAIGSDFDGAEMAVELSKTADIPPLFDALFCAGFPKSLLRAIFYENSLAFFQKICENK